MNIRATINLEINKNDKPYVLSLQQGCPWDEIYVALEEFSLGLKEMQKQSLEQVQDATSESQVVPQDTTAPVTTDSGE
jgi:hypothetical protein